MDIKQDLQKVTSELDRYSDKFLFLFIKEIEQEIEDLKKEINKINLKKAKK